MTSLVTSFMTSYTCLRIFLHTLMHTLNVYLEDVWSEKSVSCMVWENTLPSFCILKASIPIYLSISHGNLFKNRGSGNPTSRYRRDLKLRTHVHTSWEAQQTNFGLKPTLSSYLFGRLKMAILAFCYNLV